MVQSIGQSPALSPHIIRELDSQLEEWRACLPSVLQFSPDILPLDQHAEHPTTPTTTRDKLLAYLRVRYYATKSVIYRPYVYEVLHSNNIGQLSEHTLQNARLCLGSGLRVFLSLGTDHESLQLLPYPLNICRKYEGLSPIIHRRLTLIVHLRVCY